MRASEVEQRLTETPMGSKLMPILATIGLLIVLLTWIIHYNLSGIVGDYYSNPKSIRDGAESGSLVLGQLGEIMTTKTWLTPLTFVGLAFLLTHPSTWALRIFLLTALSCLSEPTQPRRLGLCFKDVWVLLRLDCFLGNGTYLHLRLTDGHYQFSKVRGHLAFRRQRSTNS